MALDREPRHRARPFDTGNAEDDARLEAARESASLTTPRHWTHFLFFTDERSAHATADQLAAEWECEVHATPDGTGWSVHASRGGVLLSTVTVVAARGALTEVAHSHGGEYDGWQVLL